MRRSVFAWVAVVLATASVVWAAGSPAAPQQAESLIRNTAQDVLSTISQDRETYQKHPQQLYALVNKHVLSHVDARYMTRLALGRYWRQANESQQQEITDAFTSLLVRTYADTLLQYSSDQIRWLPTHAGSDARHVTVRAAVQTGSGSPVAMNYRLRLNGGEWRVYDVTVGGISLVTTYRSSFADLIQQQGMDGFIKTLREKVQQATAGGS
ncbi:MAG: ABC transporter substrate-binding protein [Gammaproteobacteria bacterium]